MISAKLARNLEKDGFEMDFPSMTAEEKIISIIKHGDERWQTAIPLLARESIDLGTIRKALSPKQVKKLTAILQISKRIYKEVKIPEMDLPDWAKNGHRSRWMKKDLSALKKLKDVPSFNYFLDQYKESERRKEFYEYKKESKDVHLRNDMNRNIALRKLFSPGKRKILEKIEENRKLTPTERSYYYRSIKPQINAILNDDLLDYLRFFEDKKIYKDEVEF